MPPLLFLGEREQGQARGAQTMAQSSARIFDHVAGRQRARGDPLLVRVVTERGAK